MIQAVLVFSYLAVVLYIGIFAFRHRQPTDHEAEDYFLAGRALGPVVFLLSLFGTNMTASRFSARPATRSPTAS